MNVYLVRQDNLPGERPNYLILRPGGGHTLADRKWATRFDGHSVGQALAMVRRDWPMHTFRKVRLVRKKEVPEGPPDALDRFPDKGDALLEIP